MITVERTTKGRHRASGARRRLQAARSLALAAAVTLLSPALAGAAPPANDDRATPAALGSLPAQVAGTTAQATRAQADPFSSCGPAGAQVWYRFTAAAGGRVAVQLRADGALDAVVDVYLSERSQTRGLGCDATDSKGLGAVDFTVEKGSDYLIAVSQLSNSVAGTFTLTVVTAQPAPKPPGRPLPSNGASGTLDRVGNIQDAWSLSMREGRTYRLRLSGRSEGECTVSGALYPPRIADFSGSPVRRFGCDRDGYATFTPGAGEGGSYSVLVTAARGVRTLQSFHVEASGAGRDDTAPGRFLANRTTVGDSLNGGRIDALDLYRFSVARRSDLKLTLETARANAFDLLVLDDKGRPVQCACTATGNVAIARELAPGRYFVAVRARDRSKGTYAVRRVSRTLTRTAIGIDRRTTLGSSAKALRPRAARRERSRDDRRPALRPAGRLAVSQPARRARVEGPRVGAVPSAGGRALARPRDVRGHDRRGLEHERLRRDARRRATTLVETRGRSRIASRRLGANAERSCAAPAAGPARSHRLDVRRRSAARLPSRRECMQHAGQRSNRPAVVETFIELLLDPEARAARRRVLAALPDEGHAHCGA